MRRETRQFGILPLAVAGLVAGLATGVAAAGEIYKYVDENGNTHYVDRPTGAPAEQRVAINSRNTDNSAVQARVDAFRERRSSAADARAERAAAAEEAAKAAEDKAAQEKRCEQARSRLQSYLQSRRLYRTDENGEREYLDEAATREARSKAEQAVTDACSS